MKNIRRNKKNKLHFGEASLLLEKTSVNRKENKTPLDTISFSSDNRRDSRKKKDFNKSDSTRSSSNRTSSRRRGGKHKVNKKRKSLYHKKRESSELKFAFIYPLLVLIIIESISRRGILESFQFLKEYPIQFIANYLLLFIIFSFTIFFRRKKFVRFLVSFVLIALAFTSGILMVLRGMPLFPYDVFSIKEAVKISSIFLSLRLEVIIGLVVISFISLLIFLFMREGKKERFIGKKNVIALLIAIAIYIIAIPQLSAAKIMSPMAWNPNASFEKNGFTYSFLRETIFAIRKKPEGYNEKKMKELRSELDKKASEDDRVKLTDNKKPNIIFVQLEAFMDPTRLAGTKFNKDPMPNMRKLMENYTSGLMDVPVTGGGTARTEYEVLSGSSFDYLNPGEIPYQTFLSEKPSLSMATNLKNNGYKTVAIHNYYQKFYNRNKGLENLGFQKFVPLDVMTNVEYTPMYWPKDHILAKYIEEQLESRNNMVKKNASQNDETKASLVFTVSTQGHSKYPTKELKGKNPIKLVDSKLPESDQNQITYYANQVKEMDDFVGELIEDTNKSKEPTVLVFYGDHLPALNTITKGESGVNKFKSLFTIVNNFGPKKIDVPKDFQAYQLSTMVLDIAGQPYGPMNLVHAYMKDDKDYQEKLHLIEYDILFGKKYFLKDSEIPKKSHMEVASNELKLEKVEQRNGDFFVLGQGFNRNTAVYIDGKKVESDYYDDKTLKLYDNFYSGEKEVSLELLDNNDNKIQETNKIKFKF
ncbi:MAG: LTA synthase family protein [Peptostreptococcus sp.]|uniref:LTA synthase family protein n=1 Tax=Peptostreptococcus sp. TaxID=1262 RepID=UPI002FCBB792